MCKEYDGHETGMESPSTDQNASSLAPPAIRIRRWLDGLSEHLILRPGFLSLSAQSLQFGPNLCGAIAPGLVDMGRGPQRVERQHHLQYCTPFLSRAWAAIFRPRRRIQIWQRQRRDATSGIVALLGSQDVVNQALLRDRGLQLLVELRLRNVRGDGLLGSCHAVVFSRLRRRLRLRASVQQNMPRVREAPQSTGMTIFAGFGAV